MCGGPDPSDFNKPTAQETALSEVAAKQFNEYLNGKGVETGYLHDINQKPEVLAERPQAEAVTDLALKAPTVIRTNPNSGMAPLSAVKTAGMRSKVMNDINSDSVAQQAAGRKTFVENAMGVQSTANTAQAGLASDAVTRNLAEAEADYATNAGNMKAAATTAGIPAGVGMAAYRRTP